MRHPIAASRGWMRWASGLLLILSGCAASPGSMAPASPVASNQARIWFYRDWQPSESLNLANVDLNGAYFVSIANGSAVYRDVPPGRYFVTPDSFVPDMRQDATLELAPGQQAFVKVVSLTSWGSNNTASKNIARDAFWIWPVPPPVGEAEIAGLR